MPRHAESPPAESGGLMAHCAGEDPVSPFSIDKMFGERGSRSSPVPSSSVPHGLQPNDKVDSQALNPTSLYASPNSSPASTAGPTSMSISTSSLAPPPFHEPLGADGSSPGVSPGVSPRPPGTSPRIGGHKRHLSIDTSLVRPEPPNNAAKPIPANPSGAAPSSLESQSISSAPVGSPAAKRRRPEYNRLRPEDAQVFSATNQINRLVSLDGKELTPKILATIDRGFFQIHGYWTCYRRNYFQTSAAFSNYDAASNKDSGPCLLELNGKFLPVQSFLVGIGARVSSTTTSVELVQHTAKRHRGPQYRPPLRRIVPGGDPFQFYGFAQQHNIARFERLQFKTATANNGKRPAPQQFYSLVVELFAELADGTQVLVANTESPELVVRGRSPAHYPDGNSAAANSTTPVPGNFRRPDLLMDSLMGPRSAYPLGHPLPSLQSVGPLGLLMSPLSPAEFHNPLAPGLHRRMMTRPEDPRVQPMSASHSHLSSSPNSIGSRSSASLYSNPQMLPPTPLSGDSMPGSFPMGAYATSSASSFSPRQHGSGFAQNSPQSALGPRHGSPASSQSSWSQAALTMDETNSSPVMTWAHAGTESVGMDAPAAGNVGDPDSHTTWSHPTMSEPPQSASSGGGPSASMAALIDIQQCLDLDSGGLFDKGAPPPRHIPTYLRDLLSGPHSASAVSSPGLVYGRSTPMSCTSSPMGTSQSDHLAFQGSSSFSSVSPDPHRFEPYPQLEPLPAPYTEAGQFELFAPKNVPPLAATPTDYRMSGLFGSFSFQPRPADSDVLPHPDQESL